MILRLLKMSGEYARELVLSVISLLCASVLNLVTPEIVRRLTASLTAMDNDTARDIITYAIILTAAYALRALFRFITMYVSHIAAWNFVGGLTLKTYDKLQSLSLKYYGDKQTGQLMSRIINDTRLLEVLIAHSLPDLFGNLVLVIGVAVMIFTINPILALLALIPVPFVLLSGVIFSKKVSPLFKINQRVLGELSGTIQDNLSGMKEIQAFCAEGNQHERMTRDCRHYSDVNIHANFVNAIFNPSVEFITSMGTVIVVGLGGMLALRGAMEVSDIVGFFMYLGLFYSPLTVLARLFEDVQSALAGAERVFEVLDAECDIKDSPNAVDMGKAKGEVAFENIQFKYSDNGDTILDGVSFEAKKGEMIALVGPTGVGKTTSIALIERFYDPTGGRVLIDGKDIRDFTVESVRNNISLVLQDVFLFNGTIAENIAFGTGGATDEQIRAAAKAARADEFIEATPDGYNTVVGERGMRLSGGQKQRIAIARAILRNTPILILDEATSSVDTETEADIQAAINSLAGSRTIFIIAHRLSTVRRADKIIVLDKGKIAETGTHEELLEKGGIYANMCI